MSAESEQAATPTAGRSAEVEAGIESDDCGEPGTGRSEELAASGAPGMNVKLRPSSVTDVRLYSASLPEDEPEAKLSAGGGRAGITTERRLLGDATGEASEELPRRRPTGGNVDASDEFVSLRLLLRDRVSTTLPVVSATARDSGVSEGQLLDGTTGPKSRTASGNDMGTDRDSRGAGAALAAGRRSGVRGWSVLDWRLVTSSGLTEPPGCITTALGPPRIENQFAGRLSAEDTERPLPILRERGWPVVAARREPSTCRAPGS